VGPYIEFGEFSAVISRPGPRLRGADRQEQRQEKVMFQREAHSSAMMSTVQITEDTAKILTRNEKPILERAVDLAFEHSH
jgi:hypothetical protein